MRNRMKETRVWPSSQAIPYAISHNAENITTLVVQLSFVKMCRNLTNHPRKNASCDADPFLLARSYDKS